MVRVLPYMSDSRDRWELPLNFGTTFAGREAKLEPRVLAVSKQTGPSTEVKRQRSRKPLWGLATDPAGDTRTCMQSV